MSRYIGYFVGCTAVCGVTLMSLLVPSCTEPDPEYCTTARDGCNCDTEKKQCVSSEIDFSSIFDFKMTPVDMLCGGASDCGPEAPVCAGGRCGKCTMKSDCSSHAATPFCEVGSGKCVQCLAVADCAGLQKTCDLAKNVCADCGTNDHCTSRVCADRKCAKQDDVFVVDNRGMAVSDCLNLPGLQDGLTDATAFCDIGKALAAKSRHFMLVLPSAKPYEPVTIASDPKPVTILSKTRHAAEIATSAGKVPAVTVQPGAEVTVDGFKMTGSKISMPASDIVLCTGAPSASVTVRNCLIEQASLVGIHGQGCNVTVDSTMVRDCKRGGINIEGTGAYSITNSFIVESGFVGVQLSSEATGSFSFNTVASNVAKNNMMMDLAGGVACVSGQTVESSIVSGNSLGNMSQFTNCKLQDVMTGPDTAPMANQGVIAFVQCVSPLAPMAFGFCLGAGSPAVDLIAARPDGGGNPLPVKDCFGNPRPAGAGPTPGYDVGAHEKQ